MSLLETTLNTRDLGGKPTKNGLITIYNRIYRSDYNNGLPPNQHDINLLISNKKIKRRRKRRRKRRNKKIKRRRKRRRNRRPRGKRRARRKRKRK